MATLTVYPDSGTGATTVDGSVERNVVSEPFATIAAGAGTNVSSTNASMILKLLASATTNEYTDLYRDILTFDTGLISVVTGAVFSIWLSAASNGLGSPDVHLTKSFPASNNILVAADYQNFGGVSLANIAYASLVTASYNDFTITDLTAIVPTGITPLGLRLSWDLNNSFTGVWVASAQTQIVFSTVDAAGTVNDPKLVVTGTLSGPHIGSLDFSQFSKFRMRQS